MTMAEEQVSPDTVTTMVPSPARLYAESFSPWCQRARWALDHHGIPYREFEQVPLFAEVTLRVALRRFPRRVTVPLFMAHGVALMGSDDIARHAERNGSGSPLFPPAREDEIARWMQRSEVLMVSGRAMLLPRLGNDPEALREQLPPFVPGVLRGALQWMASAGLHHLMGKYGTRHSAESEHQDGSRTALDEVRAALAGGTRYLVGDELSYADLTIAAALQFILPVDQRYIALGPATRQAWTNESLATDYADVLGWRHGIYALHRQDGS
jgi:glutathione S-transferase